MNKILDIRIRNIFSIQEIIFVALKNNLLFYFQILRDIKQGLLQLGKEGIRGPLVGKFFSDALFKKFQDLKNSVSLYLWE